MKPVLGALCVLSLCVSARAAAAELDVQWSDGAANCVGGPHPPIQVHQYDAQTYILRQNLCSTFEAPFIYLLVGSSRALLIDTGAVEDPAKMPVAETVLGLLANVPLLVVHTHRHGDHRAGDAQFANKPNVQVVSAFLEDVQKYFGFTKWPEGVAQIDLGDRTVDVIPTPGHDPTHVAFYDRNTSLFFSGDFFLPGRLLVDDTDEYVTSAIRVAEFVKDRPVSYVLGAHIEMNRAGELFEWESTHHPDERDLPLTKEQLLALPDTLRSFNGFYSKHGMFEMQNAMHILMALGTAVLLGIIGLVWLTWRYFRRRRRRAATP
ncbi:MAG: MBL fold metallo-hydrolase [Steroidobacteraceae bacterium]